MTPEPHLKKIYLTFFQSKQKCIFIQILANAHVLLFINNALSVNPDSQTAIHYCVCPVRLQSLSEIPKAFYYDAAVQFGIVIAHRKGIIESLRTHKKKTFDTSCCFK